MAFREDRTLSFFDEDSYQSLFSNKNLPPPASKCCISKFFSKFFRFCSKNQRKEIIMEAKSDLLCLRRKYKSTILSSTFSTNKRTDISLMTGIQRKKSRFSSFLECFDANFPQNEFFILGQNPFSIIATYHESEMFETNSQNLTKNNKLEDLFIEKFRDIQGGHLVMNFEISKNNRLLNEKLCCEVQNLGNMVVNLDFNSYTKKKLDKFCEFYDFSHEQEENSFDFCYENIRLFAPFAKKENFHADFSVINALGLKSKANIDREITKKKLIKFMVKILQQAITLSESIFLLINKEVSLDAIPEIFERAINGQFKYEPLSTSIEICTLKNMEDKNYLIIYTPNNLNKAKQEVKYLFSQIYRQNNSCLLLDQYSKLEELFILNRIRLLKQIIINYNHTPDMDQNETIDIIEKILRVLFECQIISYSFIQNTFPQYQKFFKDSPSPISVKQKYMKPLGNSLILEESTEENQNLRDSSDKILNIDNSHYIAQTHVQDEFAKFEFSSYTSHNNNDISFITKSSPLLKINSLEARLEHINNSLSQINTTLNFKKYILLSEREWAKPDESSKKIEKKALAKSSF